MQDNPPGYTISALAAASGADYTETALGVAAILGGIAGPNAGLEGPLGELIHPGVNLVVAGSDPSWSRLDELLVEPVSACQRALHGLCQDADSTRLDTRQKSMVHDQTHAAIKGSQEALAGSARVAFVSRNRDIQALRQPYFQLRSPDRATLLRALPDALDSTLLVHYGDELFDHLVEKRPGKEWMQLGELLASGVTGRDIATPKQVQTMRGQLVITTTRCVLGKALAGGNPVIQNLLRHSVLLTPSTTSTPCNMSSNNLKVGYQRYYTAVKAVLQARRGGTGFRLALKPVVIQTFQELCRELQNWFQQLPAGVKPFFSEVLSLPFRLHWAFTATLHPLESDEWVLPFTLSTTWQALTRQRDLLQSMITDAEAEAQRQAGVTMLWKLADQPLTFRDLLRRYGLQRRDLHEPVLRELITQGFVCSHNGLLEISPQGRSQLAA